MMVCCRKSLVQRSLKDRYRIAEGENKEKNAQIVSVCGKIATALEDRNKVISAKYQALGV